MDDIPLRLRRIRVARINLSERSRYIDRIATAAMLEDAFEIENLERQIEERQRAIRNAMAVREQLHEVS